MISTPLYALLLSTFSYVVACSDIRVFDARDGKCAAFQPIKQLGCQACCAAAMASSIAARVCLRDNRNVQYSVQHIWDCGATDATMCDIGVTPSKFFATLFDQDSTFRRTLVPSPSLNYTITQPNVSACISTSSTNERLVSYKRFQSNMVGGDQTPSQAMQAELLEYGPFISVVYFSEQQDFALFKNWSVPNGRHQTLRPINPFNDSSADYYTSHCVSVIGWGDDYWLVQNSFGPAWGNQGVAQLARGVWGIERAFFAFETPRRPCVANQANQGGCIVQNNITPILKEEEIPNATIVALTLTCVLVIAVIIAVCYSYTQNPPPLPSYQYQQPRYFPEEMFDNRRFFYGQ